MIGIGFLFFCIMTMPAVKPVALNGDCGGNKKASKPLIEKRRRARINHSLSELKAIVVGTENQTKTANGRTPKLEKADILEMAVEYVKKLHGQHQENNELQQSFEVGYHKCFQSVCKFLEEENPDLKQRYVSYVHNLRTSSSQPSELSSSSNMDDSSSSYSSSSRSQTPASLLVEPSPMEYSSCSPFTDTDSELPRSSNSPATYISNSPPRFADKANDNARYEAPQRTVPGYESAYQTDNATSLTLLADSALKEAYERDSRAQGPLNLVNNASSSRNNVTNGQWPVAGPSNSVYYDPDCVWRPWNR